jgi:hypothetical protein
MCKVTNRGVISPHFATFGTPVETRYPDDALKALYIRPVVFLHGFGFLRLS